MAYNQASFFLFAPGVDPVVETVANSGNPVSIISTTAADSTAPKLFSTDLWRWFMDRGFAGKEGSADRLFRGTQPTPFGMEDEIAVSLSLEEDQVTGIYIRFLLTKQTPERLPEWKNLILALGHDFRFQIMGEDNILFPCTDFPAILAQNSNFIEFKESFGWSI